MRRRQTSKNLEDLINFTSFRSVAKAEKSSITEGEESGMLLELANFINF